MNPARCVWPAGALLGEGPVWIEAEQSLYWVDVKAPAVHRFVPESGERRSWPMPEQIGSLVPRRGGGFVAGMKSGFAFVDLEANRIDYIANPEADLPGNRFNDGKCDAHGRFWAGTMDDGEQLATGALYRLDPDRSWRRMDSGYSITNGPAFSPDGALLYHTDTLKRTIYAFDLSPGGEISNKRTFIQIPAEQGYPDGMTVDSEGCIWLAHYGGWRVTRFTPEGRGERVIELPVAQVTCCGFGGPRLDRLFITTAAKQLTSEALARQPLAGGLFAIDVGIQGLPANRFAG
jgi:sugar lactone lactonase YvrE